MGRGTHSPRNSSNPSHRYWGKGNSRLREDLGISWQTRTLRGPDSRAIPTLGKFLGTFTHGIRQAEGDIYVVKKLTKSLLSRPAIRDLDLVKIVAAVDLSLKAQYPSLFQGLGRIDGDYRIELRKDGKGNSRLREYLGISWQTRTLRGPDSRAIPTLGKFLGTFTHGIRQAEGDIYVVKKLTKSLLSRPAIRDLDLVKIIAAVDLSLKAQYPSLFQGLGRIDGDYRIELRKDARPLALSMPRRVAILLLKSVELELNRMVKSGVITKVNQPTEWCPSMVASRA